MSEPMGHDGPGGFVSRPTETAWLEEAAWNGKEWKVRTRRPNLRRLLAIPDCHHPYVDKRAWQLVLKCAEIFAADDVIILGDFGDCHSVGSHMRTEPLKHSLEGELSLTRFALEELQRACPKDARKVYICGNHETRLNRYIMDKAPELHGLLDIESALSLGELGWEFIPYGKSFLYGKLHITHDTGKSGMNAHRQSAAAHLGSTIIGHTHRMAYEVTGTFNGPPFLACMLGWLGDAETAGSYVHETGSAAWAKGFGVGYMEVDTGIVHVTPIPIINDRCMLEGELISLD